MSKRSRPKVATLKRRYEGAALSRRTSNWYATNASINADLWRDLPRLRERSRNLITNNPWAQRAVAVIATNMVGTGILAHVQTGAKTRDKRIMAYWSPVGRNPRLRCRRPA